MSEAAADLIGLFRDESRQRLDQMDTELLAIESGDADAESIGSLFRHAHTIKGGAGMLGFDDIRALAHAAEDVLAQVRETGVFPPDLAAPLLRATAALRAMVSGSPEPIGDLLSDLAASRAAFAGEGDPGENEPERASPPGTASPQQTGSPPGPPVPSAPAAQSRAPGPQSPARDATAGADRVLRIPAEKLDDLLDVTAEILEYRSRLTHTLGQERLLSQDVSDTLGAGGRLLGELRDMAFSMRLLPISAITGPLPRAVRDLARAAGKEVEFVISGADTELDRVILESLSEPLTHLLRNAIVHGIETPADRERASKPARGRVELRAVPRGSMVEIVIADDGRGVSPEAIEAAGREESLAGLLTKPGYSTAREVTDLAGRGVGLDAVKAYVNALGGNLSIWSQPGHGMDVVLLLPLGLALTQVLLFERGGEVYGVPLTAVEEVVMVAKTFTLQGQHALEVRGRSLPVTDVAAILGMAAPPLADASPAIVVSAGGRRAITTCDALLGAGEVVVKPLGPVLADLADYIGAAVLGDGRIALLVATATLTRRVPPATGATEPEPAPGIAAAPKILVVEDSFSVRELQRSILETAGYPIVTARDGRDALATLDRDSQIALVVTDIEMPGLDGIELTRAIRASAARSSLPVVIVTSHGSDDDRRRGIEAGADAYMTKDSFDQQTLLATVERLVGRVTAPALRVLMCDDSRAYAAALKQALEYDGDIEVAAVCDNAEAAIAALPEVRPDLVTMDVELPGMNGLDAVGEIMSSRPLPILVLSAYIGHSGTQTAALLAAGALDVLAKDDLDLSDPAGAAAAAFRHRLRVLGEARVIRHPLARLSHRSGASAPGRHASVIGVCASLGGPQLLMFLLKALPAEYPIPVLIVQHIAAGFTEGLVDWLNQAAALPVMLAQPGIRAAGPGAWLAPDGAHLTLTGAGRLALDRDTVAGHHRPSGDVLLGSIAAAAGRTGVGVVLSGIGRDGAAGAAAVRGSGGLAIAQDEESSVAFGMPKAAIDLGVGVVLPPDQIAACLLGLQPEPLPGAR